MRTEKFNAIIKERIERCIILLECKADEYATNDRLHNFKIAGQLQDCTPVKALAGMMCKHTVSIYDLINEFEKGIDITLEMWDEKIGDNINYLLLLTALIAEYKEGE